MGFGVWTEDGKGFKLSFSLKWKKKKEEKTRKHTLHSSTETFRTTKHMV